MPSTFIKFATNHTLLTKTLPRSGSSFLALCELIKNSLESDAKNIYLDLEIEDDEHLSLNARLHSLTILDDGVGVQYSNLEKSLFRIATQIRGKHGVGRFSCFQIGTELSIETSSYDEAAMEFLTSRFSLTYEQLVEADILENFSTEVTVEKSVEQRSYFQITISKPWKLEELTKSDKRKITEDFLPGSLGIALLQFFPETILEKKVAFHINNIPLDPEGFTDGSQESFSHLYIDAKGVEQPVRFVVKTVESDKINNYIQLKNSKNNLEKTVHSYAYDYGFNDGRARVMTVESPFIDEEIQDSSVLRTKDKNTYIEHFSQFVDLQVREYLTEKENDFDSFLEKLRSHTHYPYRTGIDEALLEKLTFERCMFFAHTHNDILDLAPKQVYLIFYTFQTAIRNGELIELLPDYMVMDETSVQDFYNLLIDENILFHIQAESHLRRCTRQVYDLSVLFRSEIKPNERTVVQAVQSAHWLFSENHYFSPMSMNYETNERFKKIGILSTMVLQIDNRTIQRIHLFHSDYVLTKNDLQIVNTLGSNNNNLYIDQFIAGGISKDIENDSKKENQYVVPNGDFATVVQCTTWDTLLEFANKLLYASKDSLDLNFEQKLQLLSGFTPKVGTVHLRLKKTKNL